jgi:hypothetical protein
LQRNDPVTLLAAILTLTASAAPATAAGTAAEDGREAVDRVLLPAVAGPLTLRIYALEALVVIETPSRSTPELVGAVRRVPRLVCAGLEERPFEIRLRCRSNRIVARLVPSDSGQLLEIGETRGLPWGGLDGPALVPFDPASAGLGEPCPGSSPAGRAECQLAQGDRTGARASLESITEGPALDVAGLRLGDLAFAAGDVRAAVQSWERVQGNPWQRLAAARLCESSWSCLKAARPESLYATEGLPEPLARDLVLRRARALAFLGRAGEAAQSLLAERPAAVSCAAAPSLCQRLILAALRATGPDASDGLLLWLDAPERVRGPDAYEVEFAAAAAADRSGAPLFAANILAAAAGHVPPRALQDHLLRTSELYLAGGDRVRAGVVLEFARARAGKKDLPGPRWAAVARAASGRSEPSATVPRHALLHRVDDVGLLAAATRSAQAAKAFLEGSRP